MIEYLNQKKAQDKIIIEFLQQYGTVSICDLSPVDIEHWQKVRKEAHRRKIGPFDNDINRRATWRGYGRK